MYATTTLGQMTDFGESGITSAAYLRAHEAHRLSWGISEWRNSLYGPFINVIHQRGGLNDADFERMWRNTQFRTSGRGRMVGIENPSSSERRRIEKSPLFYPSWLRIQPIEIVGLYQNC